MPTILKPTAVPRPTDLMALLVMGSMWGLQFSMLKFAALSGAGEINLLMITLVLLSVVFGGYVLLKGEKLVFSGSWVVFLFVIALFGYVLPLGATLFVAPHISVGVLSLVACLAPVITILIALLFRTEPVSLPRKLAVLLGLCSILLILLPELQLPAQGAAGWIILALVIPIAYGIEPVYVHAHWPENMSSAQLIAGEAIAGALMIFPIFLFQNQPLQLNLIGSAAIWPLLVFTAAGIVETLLYFHLIKTTGGVFVSFGTFVSLTAGVGWGMLLFSEQHGIYVWLAVLFLVPALYLACKQKRSGNADTIMQ